MNFKMFEFGSSESAPMFFIVAESVDVGHLMKQLAAGTVSEDELGQIVIAQAQNAQWANRIVAALNFQEENS